VKLPQLKFPEPHGQNILQKSTGGVTATSPSLQAEATIPAIFAAARTSLRGVSSYINSPNSPGVAAMPRSRSKQASSSEEEGGFQDDDDDISWNRKQPAKRRKQRTGNPLRLKILCKILVVMPRYPMFAGNPHQPLLQPIPVFLQ